MIKVEDVYCGYGKKVVLSDVNLTVHRAELTCFLGENGSGKTTLFKTILGLLPVCKGEISFDGKKLNQLSYKDIARLISYVPQAHKSPFPLQVIDVVLMGQYVHTPGMAGKPNKQNIEIAMNCIKILGIEKLTYRNFNQISGGEKQMVLIARAMAQQPEFIAMDEPTASLDIGNSMKVMNIARTLKEKGYGVIMTTHSPEQARQFADKVIMLKNRTVFKTGSPDEILNSSILSELYNTPIEMAETTISNGKKRKLLVTI